MNIPADVKSLLQAHKVAVLCRNPLVLVAFERDFVAHTDELAAFVRAYSGAAVLLQLGWEYESAVKSGELAGWIARFRERAPDARVVVLCNSPREPAVLAARGLEAILANHNAFLDERRYRPLPSRKRFDAAYLARLTPVKRHELIPASLAPRLLCLGAIVLPDEVEWAAAARARLAAATWISYFPGHRVSGLLSQARCGLALSAIEGAFFGSSEYLLCGLPVVDTPALGGRDALYPPEFVESAEATQDGVAAGVERWKAAQPDPWRVRAA